MTTSRFSILADGQRLEARLLDRLSRVEVRESDGDPTTATLRFEMLQLPQGGFAVLDDDTFSAGTGVAVEIASPGGLAQRLFHGIATHIRPHFEEIEANCYLEIIAMDAAAVMDAEQRAAAYPDMSDREAAEEIFDRYQIGVQAQDTPARQTEDGQLLVQRGTDWRFLHHLAERNGFVCYLEYDGTRDEVMGHFHRPPIDEPPQADLTILQSGANLTWIDFQITMTGPAGYRGAAIDPIRKRLVRTDGSGRLEAMGEDGLAERIEQGLTGAGAQSARWLLRDPFPDDSAINAQGAGYSDHAGFAVEVRGEVGPDRYRGLVRARRTILIKGVGEQLSGAYYLRSVRTTLDQGRLTQTFLGFRNALGQSGSESFGQDAEEVPPR